MIFHQFRLFCQHLFSSVSLSPRKRTVCKLATAASRTRGVTVPCTSKADLLSVSLPEETQQSSIPWSPGSNSHVLPANAVSQRAGWCTNRPLIPLRRCRLSLMSTFPRKAFFFFPIKGKYYRSNCTLINMPVSL